MGYVIGIDVGTGSVRGALVTKTGTIIKTQVQDIQTWNPKPDFYQQSTNNIWASCCAVIKHLIKDVNPKDVEGLGFDATCSMAIFDSNGDPLPVNENDDNEQNVILWMDHRAQEEETFINSTKHHIIKYVGGSISLEMMMPKILWLKRHHKKTWEKAEYFFLLPDALTWKATGEDIRSLCCAEAKANYEKSPSISQWNEDFLKKIDLESLTGDGLKKLGITILMPGELCGRLTEKAASETGLTPGTPVAVALIDAHAGALGVIGCNAEDVSNDFTTRLALICGTSNCHIALSSKEVYVKGVWGPYYNMIFPNLWVLEGGQSVAGKLIDYIIDTHPASKFIKENCGTLHITQYLNNLIRKMAKEKNLDVIDALTMNTHVWPDFHGNRAPLSDYSLRGMILGLSLATDEQDLAVLYLATIQSLAYGTRHIIDAMIEAGHTTIQSILICGGLSKNEIFIQTHADVLGLPVLIPEQIEPVLVGAAQLGAVAAGFYKTLPDATLNMSGNAKQLIPNELAVRYHDKKYKIFREMLINQKKYQKMMMDGTCVE